MAHGGAQWTYSRHLPFWQAHNCPMLTFCPVDDKIVGPEKIVAWGAKGHHDSWALDRFKYLLKLLTTYPYDYFMINEYDSMCMCGPLPEFLYDRDALWCNLFHDSGTQFLGTSFCHPPLFMSKKILCQIVETGEKYPQHSEHHFWDRWIGLMCELGKIPIAGYDHWGFAWNTIEPHLIPQARQAALDGALFFHGVKTEDCLRAIITAGD